MEEAPKERVGAELLWCRSNGEASGGFPGPDRAVAGPGAAAEAHADDDPMAPEEAVAEEGRCLVTRIGRRGRWVHLRQRPPSRWSTPMAANVVNRTTTEVKRRFLRAPTSGITEPSDRRERRICW